MNTRRSMTSKIRVKMVNRLKPGDFIHPTIADRSGGLVLKVEDGHDLAKNVTLAGRVSRVRYEHGDYVQVTEQLITGKALKSHIDKHTRWLSERDLLKVSP